MLKSNPKHGDIGTIEGTVIHAIVERDKEYGSTQYGSYLLSDYYNISLRFQNESGIHTQPFRVHGNRGIPVFTPGDPIELTVLFNSHKDRWFAIEVKNQASQQQYPIHTRSSALARNTNACGCSSINILLIVLISLVILFYLQN